MRAKRSLERVSQKPRQENILSRLRRHPTKGVEIHWLVGGLCAKTAFVPFPTKILRMPQQRWGGEWLI